MDKMLDAAIQKKLREMFQGLVEPVCIVFFGSAAENCEYCAQTEQLLAEVVALSPKLSMRVYDLQQHADVAAGLHVDKAPGFVLAGLEGDVLVDFGVRYAGIPAGHEFSSLINDIVMVSGRDSGLSEATREFLQLLQKPVHLQVFVTPT
jgi:alkyl hydroperoxide reductase subunit AhpF